MASTSWRRCSDGLLMDTLTLGRAARRQAAHLQHGGVRRLARSRRHPDWPSNLSDAICAVCREGGRDASDPLPPAGVPAQAGLGGGSGDAATALPRTVSPASCVRRQLIEWGASSAGHRLLLLARAAYCTGRGEIVTPFRPPLTQSTSSSRRLGCRRPPSSRRSGCSRRDARRAGRGDAAAFQASMDGAPTSTTWAARFQVMPKLSELGEDLDTQIRRGEHCRLDQPLISPRSPSTNL